MLHLLRQLLFTAKGMGTFRKDGFERSARSFDASDLEVDLSGRHALVTGANQGIGYATAEALARRGAAVHLVCRSASRGEAARQKIVAATGNAAVSLTVADLSLVAAARAVADGYAASGQPLHILVNNAGCLVHPRQTTSEGLEVNFATNTLAPFVLTEALLPLLRAGGPGARVVTVSSGGQYTEPLVGGGGGGVGGSAALQWEGRGFDGTRQYARDKRRQTALCERWGRDPANADVLVASCHPGWADTDAVKTSLPQFYDRLKPSLRTPEQGADTVVWLACAPAARVQPPGSPRGAFYFDRARVSPHLALGHTEYKPGAVDELAKQLTAIVDGVLSAAPSSAGATAAKA